MASLRVSLVLLLLAFTINGLNTQEQNNIAPSRRKSRLSELIRRKRSPQAFYNPWTPPYLTAIIKIPIQQGLSLWQPQHYQINRPYFIPVLGTPGKEPIYFPPQALHNNPGFPVDNPPNNAYLPPKPTDNNGTVSTMNKFDGDDRPVWGMSEANKPTRRPKPSGETSTHPPIIREDATTISNAISGGSSGSSGGSSGSSGGASGGTSQTENQNLPSRCVWAIISCCSASSNKISYDCFEQLGCNGAFWGESPCDGDIARAAISNVMNYYQSK